MLPQGGAEHSQEEILADCDLTTARKGKTMTKHMTGDSRSSATSGKMKTAPQALMKSVIVLSVRDEPSAPAVVGHFDCLPSTPAFDTAFAWNACHSYLEPMIFVHSIRDIFVCSMRKTFGHLLDSSKNLREHADFYWNTILTIKCSSRQLASTSHVGAHGPTLQKRAEPPS